MKLFFRDRCDQEEEELYIYGDIYTLTWVNHSKLCAVLIDPNANRKDFGDNVYEMIDEGNVLGVAFPVDMSREEVINILRSVYGNDAIPRSDLI